MTLDEPHEDDATFQVKGLTFLVNKHLFEQVKPVKIDFIETLSGEGFMISHSRFPANQSDTACDSTASGSCA
jgi:Fe-S cluster assembly iron-binding protein IscA